MSIYNKKLICDVIIIDAYFANKADRHKSRATDGRTDGTTDQRTNLPTDRPTNRPTKQLIESRARE